MQFISFASIDEFIEMIEIRFHNARVEIDDEFMNHIHDVYETNSNSIQNIEFTILHSFIETNLRQCVARNYLRKLIENNDNACFYVFANENTFHHYDVVHVDENDKITQFAHFIVNDDATIRVES
jgi:hypothetical protein